MRTDLLKSLPYPRLVLAAVAVTAACLPSTRAQLLIITNNRQNRERLLWAIHCAVE